MMNINLRVDWDQKPPTVTTGDITRLNRACDDFFRRRGLYIESPMARIHREKLEKKAASKQR